MCGGCGRKYASHPPRTPRLTGQQLQAARAEAQRLAQLRQESAADAPQRVSKPVVPVQVQTPLLKPPV